MAETAYPLYWPRNQLRTKPTLREATAPFTIGEGVEAKERKWNGTEWIETAVKRTRNKQVSVPVATERLEEQLRMLGATLPVLSTNLELRLNGVPRGGQRDPDDPGASAWFTMKGHRMAIACDKWMRVADNIAAIAATIRATRSVERYGAVSIEQAFRGYQALEDFTLGVPWRRVIGFKDDEIVTSEMVETKYRELIKRFHTDIAGGDHTQAAQLNVAIAQARAELRENSHHG